MPDGRAEEVTRQFTLAGFSCPLRAVLASLSLRGLVPCPIRPDGQARSPPGLWYRLDSVAAPSHDL